MVEKDDQVLTKGLEELKVDNTLKPKTIQFCDVCSFPKELCEYSHPLLIKKKVLIVSGSSTNNEIEDKKENENQEKTEENKTDKTEEAKDEAPQKKKKNQPPKVIIEEHKRSKRKHTTYITNLEKFGLSLKDTSKALSKKFACSANVTKEADGQEIITLTGEFMYELQEYLLSNKPFSDVLKKSDFKLIEGKK